MAKVIIPETQAETTFCQLADEEGRLILLPAATVHALVAKGLTSLATTIGLLPGESPGEWMTVTEAAEALVDDSDTLSLEGAKSAVFRACDSRRLTCRGKGSNRRIDPGSFALWRLARQRAADLAPDE